MAICGILHDTPDPLFWKSGFGACTARPCAETALPGTLDHWQWRRHLHAQGSGLSEGSWVTLGAHEVDDLAVAVAHVRQRHPDSTVGLWGRSMGAVTALLYSQRDPSIAGVVRAPGPQRADSNSGPNRCWGEHPSSPVQHARIRMDSAHQSAACACCGKGTGTCCGKGTGMLGCSSTAVASCFCK